MTRSILFVFEAGAFGRLFLKHPETKLKRIIGNVLWVTFRRGCEELPIIDSLRQHIAHADFKSTDRLRHQDCSSEWRRKTYEDTCCNRLCRFFCQRP